METRNIINDYIEKSIICLENMKNHVSQIEKISQLLINARDEKRSIFLNK